MLSEKEIRKVLREKELVLELAKLEVLNERQEYQGQENKVDEFMKHFALGFEIALRVVLEEILKK